MADSNRTRLSYWEEAIWGTSPTNETMQILRMTGESLNYNITNTVSNELRSDRQVGDLIQTGRENTGGFNFEFSYGSYDDFLEGALFGDWSTPVNIAEITVSASADTFSCSTADELDVIKPGQWIKVAGFTETANNGYFMCLTSPQDDTITVSPSPVTESAGDAVTIVGTMLRNGASEHFYTIERFHDDITQYFEFTGMTVNSMSMSVQADQIVTGSFDFMGALAAIQQTPVTSGSYTAVNTNDVYNAVSHVMNIMEGGWDHTSGGDSISLVQGLDFTVNNNLRGKKAIGTLGNTDIGIGEIGVSGSMNVYFQDETIYDKYVAGTESSFSFMLDDVATDDTAGDGNTYIVTFPRIKFESAPINAGGKNQDIMMNMTFQAIMKSWDATGDNDVTVQIDKFVTE